MKEKTENIIMAILTIIAFIVFAVLLIDMVETDEKRMDCYIKCGLFDCKVWEYKNGCECFKDGKIIKLEDFLN